MAVGILYESKEWSSYALERHINSMGVSAELVDMQEGLDIEKLCSFKLIVNRVFASAVFRGHEKALAQMPRAMDALKKSGIPMINPAEAHYYEISKERAAKTLAAHGLPVPKVYGVFSPAQAAAVHGLEYPCIVKPDCGGRTSFTFIVNDFAELCRCMNTAPDILFIAEQYIRPERGYITRIEVIDRRCILIRKRSIAAGGLSAYHLGSTYEAYDECPDMIKDTAIRTADLLRIETGSLDIIESKAGFAIIDVNSVSNVSEDNTEMFGLDLMRETASYVVKKYRELIA